MTTNLPTTPARTEMLDRVVMYLGSIRKAHGRYVVVDVQDDRYVLIPLWLSNELPTMLRDVHDVSIVECHDDHGPLVWDRVEMVPDEQERIGWWREYRQSRDSRGGRY